MPADCLIIGQGLAGSLLACEFERAGMSFELADPGTDGSASALAAGMVNPVTGMRFVKSWAFEELMSRARDAYRAIEAELGVTVWKPMRIRRLFRGAEERARFEARRGDPDLAPHLGSADPEGFWIEGAARVDTRALLAAVRLRLARAGRLRAERVEVAAELRRYAQVIDCRGSGLAGPRGMPGLRWEISRGQVLTLAAQGLDPEVILNRGHWVLPAGPGRALAGATHEPGVEEPSPTAEGREQIERSARLILGEPFQVLAHEAALRVGLPDRRPVAGRCRLDAGWGVLGALGNKGVLWAPSLARQWCNHLTEGVPFSPSVAAERRLVVSA